VSATLQIKTLRTDRLNIEQRHCAAACGLGSDPLKCENPSARQKSQRRRDRTVAEIFYRRRIVLGDFALLQTFIHI